MCIITFSVVLCVCVYLLLPFAFLFAFGVINAIISATSAANGNDGLTPPQPAH